MTLHSQLLTLVQERLKRSRLAQPGPWHIGNAVDPTKPCNVHTFPGARLVADNVPWLDAEHIAANDPATVIRHCEADLRRLERHQPEPNYGDETPGCLGCGRLEVPGEPSSDWRYLWPCPEVRDIAHAYGIEVP